MTGRSSRDRPLRVAVNATAYDAEPSGARNRTVGLCAALLRAGAHLDVFSSPRLDFGSLVAEELGHHLPRGAWQEHRSTLDPHHPLRRAIMGPGWFRAHVTPELHDLFLTDYYPIAKKVPTALSVHDLRDFFRPASVNQGRRRWWRAHLRHAWFRAFYPRTARQAALVITLTKARAEEAVRLLGVAEHRAVVVRPGVSHVYRAAPSAQGEGSHLLAVGMADERKGTAVLCHALRIAAMEGQVLPLIITGRFTPFLRRVLADHHDLVDRRLLRYEGVVSDARLVDLYRDAAALLHPSQYEGFGIPVLEAMSLGTPVVAAPDPAVQEVAGATASYVESQDTEAWAEAILRISDPATAPPRPNEAGLLRAAEVGWDEAARRLLAAAEDTLVGFGGSSANNSHFPWLD